MMAALATGVSKSAVPAVGAIAVVIGAAVMPARESTGTMLVLFLLGDVFALAAYGRHANWSMLARMSPNVILGLLLGFAFLAVADDQGTAIAIGLILAALMGLGLVQRASENRTVRARGAGGARRARSGTTAHRGDRVSAVATTALDAREETRTVGPTATVSDPGGEGPPEARDAVRKRRVAAVIYGSAGGFTSMVANAGGPVMSMYFLVMRLEARTFLGTAAWFFAATNVVKLPFSAGLGLITWPSLLLNLVLLPALAAGFLLGRFVIRRIDQRAFERVIVVATLAGAAYLVVQGFAGL